MTGRLRAGVAGLVLLALVPLAASGCGSGKGRPSRGIAAGLLLALTAGAAGAGVYAAQVSNKKEKDLKRDVEAGMLTGQQFAQRDEEGRKWNRRARASAFVGVLGLVGLVIVGEMMLADGNQYGPLEPPESKPIIPGAEPQAPPPTAKLPLAPRPR